MSSGCMNARSSCRPIAAGASPDITVNGVVNETAREKPRLRPDAVPTVFENYPALLLSKKAVKRTVRNLCNQGPAPKQRKRNVELADAVLCSAVDDGETRVGSHCVPHEEPRSPAVAVGISILKPRPTSDVTKGQRLHALTTRISTAGQSLHPMMAPAASVQYEYEVADASAETSGYNVARELGMPLPSELTLQRKIEGFKFAPGLLTEVLDLLKIKIGELSQQEHHAMLMLDEMQIAKGLDFDPSTGMLLGRPTVPLANNTLPESCYATHALVFMLGGISTRWKQAIAYQLTDAYANNKKAWMTGDFCQWLMDFDKGTSAKKREVLLLIDNCSTHHVSAHLSAVEVLFLPPNTTAKLQPMDQGVIANFKVHYRRRVIKRLLIDIQTADKSANLKVPLVKAIFFASRAWRGRKGPDHASLLPETRFLAGQQHY
ncbi:hypothetical protein HPB50_013650 [Hyalomma asiaticum]|uniref:Uncharacterized protein n=1 Tax=Hyalomma asiaticum TaxID=266040 RepID=A0ACB7TK25_HYAAI|nr:hypothetical protein HPB50_013650 [Hyalomma asiaticum]